MKNGNYLDVCNYQTEVSTNGNQLIFNSKLIFLKSDKQWKRQIILDKNTLKPISRKSERETCTFNIKYANINKGDYFVCYTDTFSRREIAGTSDIYINGQYTGTQLNTDTFDYAQTENANFKKIVL